MQAAIDDTLKMIRLRADCDDAVMILINHRTGECKVSTMRGDVNHSIMILEKTLQAIKKSRLNSIGLIDIQ